MRSVEEFESLLGVLPSSWMMHPSERFALIGLISIITPRRVLELGCGKGGLTLWLSKLVDEVVTVDLDPEIQSVCRELKNVTALCMTTKEATEGFLTDGVQFDLTIVDADHSTDGVRCDLEKALAFSKVIVLHDTFYPPCRTGIQQALRGKDVYFDLELVPGGMQTDGLWGGIGIVVPGLPAQSPLPTVRRATYPDLEHEWQLAADRREGSSWKSLARRVIRRMRAPSRFRRVSG
jgi:hypothetical protein